MDTKQLVRTWFRKWEAGDFYHLPVADNFKHTSPYGIIEGKNDYLNLIEANRDKFLGHHFEIHDELYHEDRACVRYSAIQDDFRDGLIVEVVAYYNIPGDISEERNLSELP